MDEVYERHKELLGVAQEYMASVSDPEHDTNHVQDVLENLVSIAEVIDEKFDVDVCVIAAYWHDVGRTKRQRGSRAGECQYATRGDGSARVWAEDGTEVL